MLEKIALMCDSMCDLPRHIAEQFAVRVVPARVIYGNKQYTDGIEIDPSEVYQRMPQEIPTTSMPSPQDIRQVFDEVRQEGFTHLIAVHISSALSGTYDLVKMMAQEVENLTINVVDTRTLSMGSGWMVIQAARNIAAGLSFDHVVRNLQQLPPKVHVFYILDTLEYLRRGGRIGMVASMIGEFLHLKPVISVDAQGRYFTYCKAKGRRKSIEKLMEIVEAIKKDRPINLAVVQGGAPLEFEQFMERFKHLPNIKEIMGSQISPVLGVHTGPGLLGVCVQEL